MSQPFSKNVFFISGTCCPWLGHTKYIDIDTSNEIVPTLLPNLNTSSDYSVYDNLMALKSNSRVF
jgi:hypothetical protein